MNYEQPNKSIFVEADILPLPDPPFGTRLIFPQVPLVDCSAMFSVQSSPAWIKERHTHRVIVFILAEKDFFRLK